MSISELAASRSPYGKVGGELGSACSTEIPGSTRNQRKVELKKKTESEMNELKSQLARRECALRTGRVPGRTGGFWALLGASAGVLGLPIRHAWIALAGVAYAAAAR